MKKTTIAISEEAKQFLEEEKLVRQVETFDEVILSFLQEMRDKRNQINDRVMDMIRTTKPKRKIVLSRSELDDLMDETKLDDYESNEG
jgi:hypothetical protein